MRGRKNGNFDFIFVITALSLLHERGTEQIREILRDSTAVHVYAARDMRTRKQRRHF